MAILSTFEKQPADVLDYDVDYTEWLPNGDAVESVAHTVTPSDLEIQGAIIVNGGTRVKLWVAGGENAKTYKVELTVTTTLGRVKQDEVRFRCKEY